MALSKLFVVAVDKHMYDILESQSIPVALLRVSYPVGKYLLVKADIGTHGYNKLTYNKFVLIRRILLLSINCLYIDSDVILLKNLFSELTKLKYANADILAQKIFICILVLSISDLLILLLMLLKSLYSL